MVRNFPDWELLEKFLPIELRGDIISRSAIASTFVAALQMAKEGKMQIRQSSAFKPIFVRELRVEEGDDLKTSNKQKDVRVKPV